MTDTNDGGGPQLNLHGVDQLEELCRERTFDFVVVGGGGSGATAAIEATDNGATVLVLEKTDKLGGSTQESGGSLRSDVDREHAVDHYTGLAQGTTPREVFEAFVDGLLQLPAWVEAHGGEMFYGAPRPGELAGFPVRRPNSAFPGIPHADALGVRGRIKATKPNRDRGAAVWDFLSRNLAELSVPLVTGARVVRLVDDDATRAIVGVEVDRPGGNITVRATKAVILCCGGFAWDRELTRMYFGVPLEALSPPHRNSGDGVRMAQAVGADLWHMSAGVATIGCKFPEFEAAFYCQTPDFGAVMVDQQGRRYINETEIEGHSALLAMMQQDLISGAYIRVPSFVVFDEETRLAGPLSWVDVGDNRELYDWSPDNVVEIERGWIRRADTLEALATELGLPPVELQQTIDAFNHLVETGTTDFWGRTPERMRRLGTPPWYAMVVQPVLINTQGGPRRDPWGAVLRPDGTRIPNLYAAGECGSIWNRLYPGAGNVSEAVVYGRLAVRDALGIGDTAGAVANQVAVKRSVKSD